MSSRVISPRSVTSAGWYSESLENHRSESFPSPNSYCHLDLVLAFHPRNNFLKSASPFEEVIFKICSGYLDVIKCNPKYWILALWYKKNPWVLKSFILFAAQVQRQRFKLKFRVTLTVHWRVSHANDLVVQMLCADFYQVTSKLCRSFCFKGPFANLERPIHFKMVSYWCFVLSSGVTFLLQSLWFFPLLM